MLIGLVVFAVRFLADTDNLTAMLVRARQQRLVTELGKTFPAETSSKKIRIATDGNLQRLSFADELLFPSASAQLKPGGEVVLGKVRTILTTLLTEDAELFEAIAVEGHADPRPVGGAFPDNWSLSSARAVQVVTFFLGPEADLRRRLVRGERMPLRPSLFSAAGFSFFSPPTEAKAEENRAYYEGKAFPPPASLDPSADLSAAPDRAPQDPRERLYGLQRRIDLLVTYTAQR